MPRKKKTRSESPSKEVEVLHPSTSKRSKKNTTQPEEADLRPSTSGINKSSRSTKNKRPNYYESSESSEDDDLINDSDCESDDSELSNETCEENSDTDDEPPVEMEEDSESDLSEEDESESEEDSDDPNKIPKWYKGKDGTKWKSQPVVSKKAKSRRCNIVTKNCSVKACARNAKTPLQAFELFFDDFVIEKITHYTNLFIDKKRSDIMEQKKKLTQKELDKKLWKYARTDQHEIRALFGLLIYLGSSKIGKGSIKHFWNDEKRKWPICSALFGFDRYRFLMRAIHFDDYRTREEAAKTDNFAIMRELFTYINNKFQDCYEPSASLCVDEQLLRFRGRVKFKQFIPSKPAKYGLKVWALVDVETLYTCMLEPYVGKQPKKDANQKTNPLAISTAPYDLVLRLINRYTKSGRNLTGDNWFTSIALVKKLLALETTYVGTIRKNKPQIPKRFQPSTKRPELSTVFGFTSKMTLVSYVPKKNRAVLLVSFQHHDNEVHENTKKKKPEIIHYYNNNKYGVDVVDQMCVSYDVSRTSRRWP